MLRDSARLAPGGTNRRRATGTRSPRQPDAVLRSRARTISAACAASSRAAASAQQTISGSPEPARTPRRRARHCWPPSRPSALLTSARQTSLPTSTRLMLRISGDTESADPARQTMPSSATGSHYSSIWASWTSLSSPNSGFDPPHRNLRVLNLWIHISTSCGDTRYLPSST